MRIHKLLALFFVSLVILVTQSMNMQSTFAARDVNNSSSFLNFFSTSDKTIPSEQQIIRQDEIITVTLDLPLINASSVNDLLALDECYKQKYNQLAWDTYSDAAEPVDIIRARAEFIPGNVEQVNVTMEVRNIQNLQRDRPGVRDGSIEYAWMVWIDEDNNPNTGYPLYGAESGVWAVHEKGRPYTPNKLKVYEALWSIEWGTWTLSNIWSRSSDISVATNTITFRGGFPGFPQSGNVYFVAIDRLNGTDVVCNEWVDLDEAEEDYKKKISGRSNTAAFAYQVWCIADASGREWIKTGPNGWAGGFVKHVFDYMFIGRAIPDSLKVTCNPNPQSPNEFCFRKLGEYHFSEELEPAFDAYCSLSQGDVDYDRWDSDHETFFVQAVQPCLDQLFALGELAKPTVSFLKRYIPATARSLREETQGQCRARYGTGVNSTIAANLAELPLPPTKEDIFDPSLEEGSTLRVDVGENFFVPVGAKIQIRVENLPQNVHPTYELNVSEEVATISSDGVLSINSAGSPFPSMPTTILIFASSGEDWGIGQLAIQDSDSDGDRFVDSFEIKFGLDPYTPNDPHSDKDADGISDSSEMMMKTDPTNPDTDGDGYKDGCEVDNKSDPTEPAILPKKGCEYTEPTATPTPTITPTPTETLIATPIPTVTASVTHTPTPVPDATATATPSPTNTIVPQPTEDGNPGIPEENNQLYLPLVNA
jgi:hypothetical protein